MAQIYLHKCAEVKRTFAERLAYDRYALFPDVETRDRQAIKTFLTKAAEWADTDLSGLARLAGVAPSTLTRFVNQDAKSIPSTRTLSRIAEATGYPFPFARSNEQRALLEALGDVVASVLGLHLTHEATLSGADLARVIRWRQWIDVIERLDPATERRAFDLLLGMTEAPSSPQENANPGKLAVARHRA